MKTQIREDVWEKFVNVCAANYPLSPERIATALVYDFCCKPPKELWLVGRERPEDRPSDDEGEEWKLRPRG
jgi:hypothetical protein